MAKITKRGGPSVRVFASPATVLRQRGKLGPYGGEAKVETFTAVAEPVEVEPKPAVVRAWAAEQGIDVSAKGKLPADVLAAYKAAHTTEPPPDNDDDAAGG
jgi:hypothetical protein